MKHPLLRLAPFVVVFTACAAADNPGTADNGDSSTDLDSALVDSHFVVDSAPRDTIAPPDDTAVADTGVSDTGDTGVSDSVIATDSSPDGDLDSATADTGDLDSTFFDSVADTGAADTDTDAVVVDSAIDAPIDVVDTAIDTPLDGACGTVATNFALSEIMVRATAGSSDPREWIELTNYDLCPHDVSGVTVKVVSSTGVEKATFTFPSGTTLAAGEAVVIADIDTAFKTDVSTAYSATLGKVFSFDTTAGGSILVNGSDFEIDVYGAGASTAYEKDIVKTRSWSAGVSFAYPIPATACPVSGRTDASGALKAPPWKDVSTTAADSYGSYGSGASAVTLYGTPTKANTGVSCP